MSLSRFQESDMAPAVVSYLTSLGYDVRSELMDTDIIGIHEQDIPLAQSAHDTFLATKRWPTTALRSIGVELKRQFSVDVIAQAARAKRRFGAGAIVVPEPVTTKGRINTKSVDKAKEICAALGVSLLFYCKDGTLRVVHECAIPSSATFSTKSFVREFLGRSKDINVGGTTGIKRMTAYAEATCKIVSFLHQAGVAHIRSIADATGEPKTASILSKNHKKLFTFVSCNGKRNGYYCLTSAGRAYASEANAQLAAMTLETEWPTCEVPSQWKEAFEAMKIETMKKSEINA